MRVLLGLSGGVDSAIAAYLLLKEGHEVTGCFMRNWDSLVNGDYLGNPNVDNDQCPQEKDYEDALMVAKLLGIPLIRIDYVKEYWDEVFTYFLNEYEKGRTPNPDILCNREIKFGPFLKYARENGYDAIAMGHYAKKVTYEGRAHLAKPKDLNKDQTYFLCALSEEQIAYSLFPMENITKVEARAIASELGLSIANKHGSTGICFIGERNFREFLKNYFPAKPGPIIDLDSGKTLAQHQGVLYYTIGQRKGLGIGGIAGLPQEGWFVAKKDVANNILYVQSGDEEDYLYSDASFLTDLNWIGPKPYEKKEVMVKFRYRDKDHPCSLILENGGASLLHHEAVKAVTPGQWAALYSDDGVLLGGGIIDKTYRGGKRTDL